MAPKQQQQRTTNDEIAALAQEIAEQSGLDLATTFKLAAAEYPYLCGFAAGWDANAESERRRVCIVPA